MQLSVCFNFLNSSYMIKDGKKVKQKEVKDSKFNDIVSTVQNSWCINNYFDEVKNIIDPDLILDFEDDTSYVFEMIHKIEDITKDKLIKQFNDELSFPCYLWLDAVEPMKIENSEKYYTISHAETSEEYLNHLDKLCDRVAESMISSYEENDIVSFNDIIFLVIINIIEKNQPTIFVFPEDK